MHHGSLKEMMLENKELKYFRVVMGSLLINQKTEVSLKSVLSFFFLTLKAVTCCLCLII